MITIINGKDKIVCTTKTFEDQYKQLGYQIASDKQEATDKVASFVKEEDNKKEINVQENEEIENKKIIEKYGLDKKEKAKTRSTKKGK